MGSCGGAKQVGGSWKMAVTKRLEGRWQRADPVGPEPTVTSRRGCGVASSARGSPPPPRPPSQHPLQAPACPPTLTSWESVAWPSTCAVCPAPPSLISEEGAVDTVTDAGRSLGSPAEGRGQSRSTQRYGAFPRLGTLPLPLPFGTVQTRGFKEGR